MARYNTSLATNQISGSATVSSPYQGAFTELTGSAPYTVTLPSPVLYPGTAQTYYNATSGVVTLSTPGGNFTGLGGSGTANQTMPTNTVVSVVSDGTNYVTLSEDGSVLYASTATITGNLTVNTAGTTTVISPATLTMAPTTGGSLDNVNIGANTRGSGAFNTLAANSAVTFTAGTASTTTGTGTLVVTGGIGASGAINSASVTATTLTGTLQTAAQTNITSVGTLTGLSISGIITSTAGTPFTFQNNGNTGTYTQTTIYTNQNNTSGDISNGIFIERGRLTDSASGEIRNFVIGSRGGQQQVIVDKDGNVGIGVTPNIKLHVATTGAAYSSTADKSTNMYGISVTGSTNENTMQGIWFASGSAAGTHWSGIAGSRQQYTTDWSTKLTFYTHDENTSNITQATEKMVITGAGKVGIGTTSPGSRLSVSGANTSSVPLIDLVASGTGTFQRGVRLLNSGMNSGDHIMYAVGRADNSRNMGQTYFYYSGDGSTSNRISMGLHSVDDVFNILGTGNVGIGRTDPGYKLDISGSLRASYGFRSYQLSHSSTNGSAGSGSPTTTNIVQVGDNTYEYGFYFAASTGGYPTCPYSYWVLCPVQKQNTGSLGWAELTIRGVHRGMWGTSYDEYASIVVGSGSDGGGIWVKEWKNGDSNNSSNRIRVGWMNYDGVYNEGTNYNTGYNLATITGNSIGNSYYKMPLFLKIYTNCGADKEYHVTVRTTDPGVLGPPFKGPMWLTYNTNPTSSGYW